MTAWRDMTCTVCPVGCQLQVRKDTAGTMEVQGHRCPRGLRYARDEAGNPVRSLRTSIRVLGGARRRLPVQTAGPIPKGQLMRAMAQINQAEVPAPIRVGQVLIADIAGTGVPLLARADCPLLEDDQDA